MRAILTFRLGRRLHSRQVKRGAVLYANACASCHGTALNGGESAPPLTGGEFFSNWNGLTVGDLFDRIRVPRCPRTIRESSRVEQEPTSGFHAQHG